MIPIGFRLLVPALLGLATPGAAAEPPDSQIRWQRTLEDALAISRAEHRPMLVAVSMDGESASERIVRERYRDPSFVAMTRPFVCVVASAFRHAPRDHDELGRRIPCPRLGEVTCGEHIALEPIVFERCLGGERIAPRHALILPDGTKSFDLFLLFDMRVLDGKLAESRELAPPPSEASQPPRAGASLAVLAGARDHHGRLAFETRLLDADSTEERGLALRAIAESGDAGSVEAIRILLASRTEVSMDLLLQIAKTAKSLKSEAPFAATARDLLSGLGRWPGSPGLDDDQGLLMLLGNLDASSAATRSLLLAYGMLGGDSEASIAGSSLFYGVAEDEMRKIALAAERAGGPTSVAKWLSGLREMAPVASGAASPTEELPEESALESELADLDRELGARPDDPDLLARYGKTTLALARRRIESGGSGAQLLLQDADHFLEQASRAKPAEASLLLARARAAYLLGRFEEQERIAQAAEAVARGDDRFEALRWVGDASARLLGARSGGDPAVEVEGILRGAKALMEVAAGPEANETDWISLASFFGALGMRREELAVLQLAAERMPASTPLRNALNASLWAGGRIDLAAPKAEWILARHPDSGDCAWHAGYAHLLVAEERRRAEEPDRAIESYETAERRFRDCASLRADYQESADHHRALCVLGRGFAHLLASRRAQAAECLAEGLAIRPQIASVRDGLDREAVDLLDGALEWRADGPSPVVVADLLAALERADPANASWPRSVSDTELREALRADGRGEVAEGDRYLRASIDAARRALAITDDAEDRRVLAQPLTIFAERLLWREESDAARALLSEAATLLGETAPAEGADAKTLEDLAARLRESLGEARPRFRPGR